MESDESVSYRALSTDPRLLSITFASFTATFGIFAVSPAFPGMVTQLGISQANIGLIQTAYVLPGIFLLPIIGVITDIYGRRVVFIPALVLFGLAGTGIGLVDSLLPILFFRVLQGIGGVTLFTVAITLVGDIYSGPTGSAAQGLRLSSHGLSAVLVPAVAGFLAGIHWNYPFFLFLFAIPAAILAYLYIPEPIETNQEISIGQKLREYPEAIRTELTDADTAILVAGGFFQGFSYFSIVTFVPLFAVDSLGASLFIGGAVLSARGITRIPVSPISGWFLTIISRKRALVLTLALSATATALMGMSPNVIVLALIVAVYGIADALFTPIHRDGVTNYVGTQQRAGVMSLVSILYNIGAAISPAIFGFTLVYIGYTWVLVFTAAGYGVYGLLVLLFFSSDG